jgi:hypothetical protein
MLFRGQLFCYFGDSCYFGDRLLFRGQVSSYFGDSSHMLFRGQQQAQYFGDTVFRGQQYFGDRSVISGIAAGSGTGQLL